MKFELDLYTAKPGLWRRFLAGVYGLAIGFRLWLKRIGWLRASQLPAWVISVGNLTAGGAGKTPAVKLLAAWLKDNGFRVAVLSRGYRREDRESINVVSDGTDLLLGPRQAGDEPYLLARSLPGVPVLVGSDRYRLGLFAMESFDSEVFILDDGFQHLGLKRQVNLLLLDADRPWGNGRLLPAGALREPVSEARRATAFLLTRASGLNPAALAELKRLFPDKPVFLARHRPSRLVRIEGDEIQAPEYLKGRRVMAFCGLARPMTFLDTLVQLGAEVTAFIKWPDHYQPDPGDLDLIKSKARELGLEEAVTTAKDAVKLTAGKPVVEDDSSIKIWVLEVEMEILDKRDEFFNMMSPREL